MQQTQTMQLFALSPQLLTFTSFNSINKDVLAAIM